MEEASVSAEYFSRCCFDREVAADVFDNEARGGPSLGLQVLDRHVCADRECWEWMSAADVGLFCLFHDDRRAVTNRTLEHRLGRASGAVPWGVADEEKSLVELVLVKGAGLGRPSDDFLGRRDGGLDSPV